MTDDVSHAEVIFTIQSLVSLRSNVCDDRRMQTFFDRLAQSLAMSRGAVDPEKVYRSAWLAWLMSGRAREDGVSVRDPDSGVVFKHCDAPHGRVRGS